MTDHDHWHLDKRVPISLIAAILLQTAAFGWMLATINSKVDSTAQRTAILEARAQERFVVINQNVTSIAVINESLRNVEATLDRIETAVSKDER